MELEKKAADLKGELENALKENALLQKQVNELSEFQSLSNMVEMQKKEVKKNLTFFLGFVLFFAGNVLMEAIGYEALKPKVVLSQPEILQLNLLNCCFSDI